MSNPGYPSELILDLLNELTDLANDAEEYHPTPAELASSIRKIRDGVATNLRAEVNETSEQAQLAGMAHGVDAYNEAMGWDTSSPESCGHHCVGAYPPCHCMNDEW